MSKRVSNKPSQTGARTRRTHRVYLARMKARANRKRVNAEVDARLREAARARMAEQSREPARVSLLGKARAFVARVFKGGRP